MNEFMESFNGDFIFDVENLAMGVPKMTLMAEVKNDYICETILKATEGLPVKFQKQEEGVYSLQGMVTMYNKDGKLIITTDPEVISNLSTGFNPSLEASECAKFYKNSYGAFFVDIKGILNSQLFSMLAQQAGQANIAKILLADFSYMAASNVSLTENNIEIAMVNTTDNSLKVIIDTVKKLVAMQN